MSDPTTPDRPATDIERLRQSYPLWQIDAVWAPRASGPDLRVLTARRCGVRLAGFSAAELAQMIEGDERRYGWPRT
jgi:hypothetical protein